MTKAKSYGVQYEDAFDPIGQQTSFASIIDSKDDTVNETDDIGLVFVSDEPDENDLYDVIFNINGTKYLYKLSKDILEKVSKIAHYSTGKALAWVKANSKVAGKKLNESSDEEICAKYLAGELTLLS